MDQSFKKEVGIGVVITNPNLEGVDKKFIYQLDVQCSNNQVKFEALIISLKLLKYLDVKTVQIIEDSQLAFN